MPIAERAYTRTPQNGVAGVFHRLVCERDLIKSFREISSNDIPPLSDLAKGGINVGYERRLRLAVSSHVCKGGDRVVTTVTLFDKE